MKVLSLCAAVAVAALCLGCQQDGGPAGSNPQAAAAKAAQTANLICPITGNLVSPNGPMRQWEGRAVGFSAADSATQWDKLSEADKKTQFETAVNKQMSMVVNSRCPMKDYPISRAIPMRQFDGKIVGFCCAGCPHDWDKLTDAQKKARLAAAMK